MLRTQELSVDFGYWFPLSPANLTARVRDDNGKSECGFENIQNTSVYLLPHEWDEASLAHVAHPVHDLRYREARLLGQLALLHARRVRVLCGTTSVRHQRDMSTIKVYSDLCSRGASP